MLRAAVGDQAERVRALTRSAELAGQCRLVVDATGVGRPVVELLHGRIWDEGSCW
jgi:hypothetical protein